MRLNDLEKIILVTERDFTTITDKLNHVNLRMGYGKEIDKNTGMLIPFPAYRKQIILPRTYYRRLGGMKTKANARGYEISKNYLFDLINEHDTLLSDRKELGAIIQEAYKLEKIHSVIIAKREQIDLGRRIQSVKETIKTLMEEPDLEDEDQIERKIQLLTTS